LKIKQKNDLLEMELEMAREKLAQEEAEMRELNAKVKSGREISQEGIAESRMEFARIGTSIGPIKDPEGIGSIAKPFTIIDQRK
jgi:phage terminase Nu1 subunit (DNA packaging protein)